MKRTWVGCGLPRDWMDREQGEGRAGEEYLGADGGIEQRFEIG